jgi:phage repressor protein C with HTH and peptisase S24 domain
MSWADPHIARLGRGESAQFRPHGNSMTPRIRSGQLVTVSPFTRDPEVGDAVLCRVRGTVYVHLIKAIQGHGERRRYLIGNNHGGVNGWTPRAQIFGLVTAVDA